MIRTNNDIATRRKEIGSRLAQFRDLRGLLQFEIAKELELSPRSYQNYELGIREVPVSVVSKMIKKYGLDSHWLITGEGGPFHNDPVKVARDAVQDVADAAEAAGLEPELNKLPDVVAILVKNLVEDMRVGNPDNTAQLVRLASKSAHDNS
jgi:transcriptional regulator with XRE-family HTH domain